MSPLLRTIPDSKDNPASHTLPPHPTAQSEWSPVDLLGAEKWEEFKHVDREPTLTFVTALLERKKSAANVSSPTHP